MLLIPYAMMAAMWIVVWLAWGGGAILSMPILVYLFGIDPVVATSYSLILVGSTALIAVMLKIKTREIRWKTGLVFWIPSVIATFVTRHAIVPIIPDHVMLIEKGTFLLVLFAALMFCAGCSMVCKRKLVPKPPPFGRRPWLTMPAWIGVWVLAGLVWAGWGFLIVPALMMIEGLTIHNAIATSLFIISMQSLIGVTGDFWNSSISLDPVFLAKIAAIAILGLFAWLAFQKRISGEKLSKWFGLFSMAMALFMITKELFF